MNAAIYEKYRDYCQSLPVQSYEIPALLSDTNPGLTLVKTLEQVKDGYNSVHTIFPVNNRVFNEDYENRDEVLFKLPFFDSYGRISVLTLPDEKVENMMLIIGQEVVTSDFSKPFPNYPEENLFIRVKYSNMNRKISRTLYLEVFLFSRELRGQKLSFLPEILQTETNLNKQPFIDHCPECQEIGVGFCRNNHTWFRLDNEQAVTPQPCCSNKEQH